MFTPHSNSFEIKVFLASESYFILNQESLILFYIVVLQAQIS